MWNTEKLIKTYAMCVNKTAEGKAVDTKAVKITQVKWTDPIQLHTVKQKIAFKYSENPACTSLKQFCLHSLKYKASLRFQPVQGEVGWVLCSLENMEEAREISAFPHSLSQGTRNEFHHCHGGARALSWQTSHFSRRMFLAARCLIPATPPYPLPPPARIA